MNSVKSIFFSVTKHAVTSYNETIFFQLYVHMRLRMQGKFLSSLFFIIFVGFFCLDCIQTVIV